MSAARPPLTTLEGRFIRLEPMSALHLPGLFHAIAHPVVFAGGYGGGPAGYRGTESEFIEWAEGYYDWGSGNVYAAVVSSGPLDGVVVGTSTLSDFELQFEAAHIGWTAWDPRVWGTAVNLEAKWMMLDLAFAHDFGRVRIQADAINERSRAAIAAIGATFEGVMRRDRPRADGTWRDTAVFSVLRDEWPTVRGILEQRMTRFEGSPVAYRER